MRVSHPVCLSIGLSILSLGYEGENNLCVKLIVLNIELGAPLCLIGNGLDAVQADTVRSGFTLCLGGQE